jgi:hypothetical protein
LLAWIPASWLPGIRICFRLAATSISEELELANTVYNATKNAWGLGNFVWTGSTWYAALISNSYTPNFSTDTWTGSVVADQIGGSVALASCAVSSAGALSANSVTFTGISASLTVKSIVVYYYNGTSYLLAFYYDTGTGLPLTTTGANVTVDWNGTTPSGNLLTF